MTVDLTSNWLGALAVDAAGVQRAATAKAGPESRVAAILTLHEFPGATVGQLAEILGLTHSAAVRVVDGLENDDLAVRARHDIDARRTGATLTASGRRTAARLQRDRLAALGELMDPLTTAERAQFGRLLDKMLRGRPRERSAARLTCRFCVHSACTGPSCPVGSSVPVDTVDTVDTDDTDDTGDTTSKKAER